ncbi:TIGR01244 family sulfur transferase [Ideonella sp.]|uniref:TIGR01244 family sulfur transferase n=1 Tax=Ideonella sp. TaxID=1929293 RepID=UPI003BB4D3CB
MNTNLPLSALTPEVFVSPQLDPAAMAELAQLGFRSVINNRPDGEGGPEQPLSSTMAAAAAAAGLEYRHLPVQGAYQSPEEIAAFGALAAELPRPLLAFCRSGARSTRLWQASGAA